MMFLAATRPGVALKAFGAEFVLIPIRYPEVDVSQVLAMEDALGSRILQCNHTQIQRLRFEAHRLPGFPLPLRSPEGIPAGSRILIIRGGGIGDVLMCTPVIRELRRRLPGTRLTLATFEQNGKLFRSNPDLDDVVAQPLTLGQLMAADYFVEFTGPDRSMNDTHMTDYYLSCIGIRPETVVDKRPVLASKDLLDTATCRELAAARAGFERIVYLNGLASDRLRDIPPDVLSVFPDLHPEIRFAVPADYPERYPEQARPLLERSNVMEIDTKGSLEKYITALSVCDAAVTTDSSVYHIAAALDKPCLTLFGPIDPGLRTRYYPTVVSLEPRYQGKTCRSPCGKSMFSEFYNGQTDGVPLCPEARHRRSQFSPCLSSYAKDRLNAGFRRLLTLDPKGAGPG